MKSLLGYIHGSDILLQNRIFHADSSYPEEVGQIHVRYLLYGGCHIISIHTGRKLNLIDSG